MLREAAKTEEDKMFSGNNIRKKHNLFFRYK